ncbi:G-protein coupled receptor family C group 5 member C-like [Latimeria chalumnae]|uniref:G protein-coupled receptor, class C, group 5, member C n=1 Tax=Latimeria chalumnae TaxID=7897 RepID=M3XIJ5_LATCH|nr:PREDICTED: G-protein coupled receptor family C group 5 member C-like [Latimeria chalumnae]|eukprot:XP_006000682.1 PREDICTED: G-protein coupled receptor family C group 5 member C-like [Latimeria chalumnae]
MWLWIVLLCLPLALAQNTSTGAPAGCGQDLSPIYYHLCSLQDAWGIVLEAITVAGLVSVFILALVFLGLIPFMENRQKKGILGVNFFFIFGVFGLFAIVFAFIVQAYPANCSVRRFLFGVLFSICFSCLAAHAVRLNFLVRRNHGPGGWATFLLALTFFLVEVVINVEWLLITNVRHKPLSADPSGNPCDIANQDFVSALVYVMFLILLAFVAAWPALCGGFSYWKYHATYILVTTFLSIAIWVVWIIMYIYGNRQVGNPLTWDDPVLAIALVSNAWVFVFFYIIPELVDMTKPDPETELQGLGGRQVQDLTLYGVKNKAFSMEELESGNPPSPYISYVGNGATAPRYAPHDSNKLEPSDSFHLPRAQMEPWRSHY